jgi:anti-anti-sigma regulatory factor
MDFGITDGAIDERTHVIEPHGEIDLATVPLLKARVDAHFIDSSGLGIMLSAHGRLEAAGGMLVIACADDLICRVFTIAGVRDVLNVQKTRRDALAQVGDYARAG